LNHYHLYADGIGRNNLADQLQMRLVGQLLWRYVMSSVKTIEPEADGELQGFQLSDGISLSSCEDRQGAETDTGRTLGIRQCLICRYIIGEAERLLG
jgi:hypothetical protein